MFEKSPYIFKYGGQEFYIPEYMEGGIKLYITKGIPPGSFLTAIICNDLIGAIAQADDVNIHNIPAFVAWFYNEAPTNCWGSKEKMIKWINKFREIGEKEARKCPVEK